MHFYCGFLESVVVKIPKTILWIFVLGMNILKLTHFVIFPAKLLHSTSNGKPYLEKFLSKEFFIPAKILFSANIENIFVQILWEFTDLPLSSFLAGKITKCVSFRKFIPKTTIL